jgi:hypothetical protein
MSVFTLAVQRLVTSSKARWSLLIALLFVGVVVGFRDVLWPGRPAPFIVLHQPWKMPVPLRELLGRCIPATPSWAWAWSVEQAVWGRRKPVNFHAEIVTMTDSSHLTLSNLSLGTPAFSDTNDLQIWLLGADQLKTFRERLQQTPGMKVRLRPRISTADGIESRLFSGESVLFNGSTSPVGLAAGCFARVHADSTDLTACITLSALVTNEIVAPGPSAQSALTIYTNLDAAFRVQVPKGNGLFLLDGSRRDPNHKPVGVIIDPL